MVFLVGEVRVESYLEKPGHLMLSVVRLQQWSLGFVALYVYIFETIWIRVCIHVRI